MLHLMFSFSSVLLWCKCWLSSLLDTSNKVALRCRAEADYFESGCVLGFEPIRMNISTSLHRSHFGSRPSPWDAARWSLSCFVSSTLFAHRGSPRLHVARARPLAIETCAFTECILEKDWWFVNASWQRYWLSVTLRHIVESVSLQLPVSQLWVMSYPKSWVYCGIILLWDCEATDVRQSRPHSGRRHMPWAFSLHGSYMHYPFTACCRHLIRRHYRSIAERQSVELWFTRLEIYLLALSWFLMTTSPLQHQWWVRTLWICAIHPLTKFCSSRSHAGQVHAT